MQRPWKKWRHGGSTRTTSPSSSSCRHTTHSAAFPLLPLLLLPPSGDGDGDGDADADAARARYVNVGSAAMSSTLSPIPVPDDDVAPWPPAWSWRHSARTDRP